MTKRFYLPITMPPGAQTEKRQYGYRPNGELDSWVILCTVRGAVGPFTASRLVTYGVWIPDERDKKVTL